MTDSFNDRSSTISLLLTRRSGKAANLVEPGPDAQQLETILQAAVRVPDHGKLAPWRVIVVQNRAAFADLLIRQARKEDPAISVRSLQTLRDFAHDSPTLVALVHVPVKAKIPGWEQKLSTGAVAQNLLLAAHASGFVGNWLTTSAAYLPGVAEGLGIPHGRIAGFLFIGTPTRPLEERPRPRFQDVVSYF